MSDEELPKGWTSSVIDQLCHRVTDGTHFSPKEQNRRGGYKYVTAKNIREWGLDLSDVTYVSEAIHRPIFRRCNPEKDDVLYIKDGATAGIAILNPLEEEFSLLSSVALLKPDRSQLDPSFLKWYLMSPVGRKAMLDQVTGSAITRLTLEIIRKSVIPAPPLPEQKRIVAKLEGLLVRTNAARERLVRVPAILKRFRQAVLAAACDGRLTEDWRAAVSATGDQGHEEEAPAGWRPVALANVCQSIADGDHQPPPKAVTGVPFIVISNLTSGNVDFGNTRFVPKAYFDRIQPQRRPRPGDTLVSLVGTIGVTVQVRDPRPFCFQRHIGLLRPNRSVFPEFLTCMVQSRGFLDQAVESATGSAQLTVPLKALRGIRVLLPPIAEQREITCRVEALFKVADAIEKRVATATARAEKLTQAILAKAFRGELVPTEAELARREGRDYEPAGKLLERVTGNRADGTTARKRPGASKRGKEWSELHSRGRN